MQKKRIALAVAVLAGLWIPPAPAQQSDRAEVLLEAARKKEILEGNLDAAIKQYKEIVSRYSGNRSVAAKALIRMGLCYEKLGAKEAQDAYRKVISSYPEQQGEVATAQERLARLAKASEQATDKPRFRNIRIAIKLASATFQAHLSPDGKTLAFSSGGAIWTVPVPGKVNPDVAGEPVRLTAAMEALGLGLGWSGNGKWVAFNAGKNYNEVYVIPSEGGEPKRVPVKPVRGVHPYNFNLSLGPDGKTLAFASMDDAGFYQIGIADVVYVHTVAVGGGVLKRVTDAGSREPAFSPDGRRIAYVKQYQLAPYETRSEVRVVPADGGTSVLVTEVPNRARSPIWSPDGRMVAFLIEPTQAGHNSSNELWVVPVSANGRATATPTSIKLPQETNQPLAGWTSDNKIGLLFTSPEHRAIYTVPASGGKAAQVTPAGYTVHPRWSPDGARIWFRYYADVVGLALGFVAAGGGTVTSVRTGSSAPVWEATPGGGNAISADGKTVVFSGVTKAAPGVHLWTMPVEGGEPVQLTKSPHEDRFPCWCPGSKTVAFIRGEMVGEDKKYVSSVHTVSAGGGEARRITSESDAVAYAGIACSPDGKWIAYFDKDRTIRVKPLDSGESKVVAKVSGISGQCEISWSPDGRKLAYNAGGKIWIVSPDEGKPVEVETGLEAQLFHIAWSPDGQKLAFAGEQGGEPELWLMEDFLPLVQTRR